MCRGKLNPHSNTSIILRHTSIHSSSLKEDEKENITIKLNHHDKRVKCHTRRGRHQHKDQKSSTQGRRSTRVVITKWEDNPFTHKTEVYNQDGETTLLPTRPRCTIKVGKQPFYPQDQGSNLYFVSQGIQSIGVPYNNFKFDHHHIWKVQTGTFRCTSWVLSNL